MTITQRVMVQSKDADEAHNYLTDLGYGYSDIRAVMQVAETDPNEQWFGLSSDAGEFEHAVRFVRKSLTWEVAEVRAATITERVIKEVRLFPGYGGGYYAHAAGVTREQFRSVARRHLTIRKPGDDGWDFSYTAYFPKSTDRPEQAART